MKLIKLSALMALCSLPLSLLAQVAPQLPTNLSNVTTSPAPPAGFNALTASDQALQSYGYPPRPDAASSAYAGWAKAVSAPQTRIANPVLEMTDLQAGPVKGFKDTTAASSKEGGTPSAAFHTGVSNNWSGYVLVDNINKPFGGNNPGLGFLIGTWVVPIAQQAFSRNGDNVFDFCVQWVGIDGFGSSDVLQAGTETDAFRNSSNTSRTPFYAAWFEWFPFNLVRISNFPVGPGEEVFCEVWNTSPTVGHAFFVDFSRNTSIIVTFSAPQNTRLVGNCAEWIVERPGVSGGLSTLANYVACPFDQCEAVGSVGGQYNRVFFPNSFSSIDVFSLTMLDNAGKGISSAALQGTYDLWFRNFGSSH